MATRSSARQAAFRRKQVPPILRLPNETLSEMCTYLATPYSPASEGRKDLRSLAPSSSTLRHPAQRQLFRGLAVRNNNITTVLRTLLLRPDLRGCVEGIRVHLELYKGIQCTAEDQEMLIKAIRLFGKLYSSDGTVIHLPDEGKAPSLGYSSDKTKRPSIYVSFDAMKRPVSYIAVAADAYQAHRMGDVRTAHQVLRSLLFTLCLNVKNLVIAGTFAELVTWNNVLLPKLQRLEWCHRRLHKGLDSTIQATPPVRELVLSHTRVFCTVRPFRPIHVHGLKMLGIQFSTGGLQNFLASMKEKLEYLILDTVGTSIKRGLFLPGELESAGNLKLLAGRLGSDSIRVRESWREQKPWTLRHMTCLQDVLWLDECILPHKQPDPIQLFPKSIRRIAMNINHWSVHLAQWFLDLAIAAPYHFPYLREVTLGSQYLYDHIKADKRTKLYRKTLLFEKAFEEAGVECRMNVDADEMRSLWDDWTGYWSRQVTRS